MKWLHVVSPSYSSCFSLSTNSKTYHDRCGRCKKKIYTHNIAIPCHLDGLLYHSRCLKIDNVSALEIQKYPDWWCPDCVSRALPFMNDTAGSYTEPLKVCHYCDKFISASRHYFITCSTCESLVHGKCANDYVCMSCSNSNTDSLNSPHFNIFDPGEIDDYQMFDHDFEIDSHLETLTTSSAILDNCDYIDPLHFQRTFLSELESRSYLSFYFLNINGFKANFDEYVLNHISVSDSFDIICFAETNVDSDDIAQFNLGHDYNCLDIPKALLFITVSHFS